MCVQYDGVACDSKQYSQKLNAEKANCNIASAKIRELKRIVLNRNIGDFFFFFTQRKIVSAQVDNINLRFLFRKRKERGKRILRFSDFLAIRKIDSLVLSEEWEGEGRILREYGKKIKKEAEVD